MGWSEYVLAFVAFFASHALPLRPPVKAALVARIGRGGFGLVYSALSLAMLAWLIGAAGRAPHVALWAWAPWQNLVPLVLMIPVCLIVALAIGRPNPFSFGGARDERFDPARPGLVRWTRHPLLAALALWAFAHLVPNGDLAHALLFASFAGFALVGARMIDRRKRRETGAEWARLAAAARAGGVSFAASEGVRALLGVALYVALIVLHPRLFGVDPLPHFTPW